MRICRSPWLIAACRVLHRLPVPRHSPCALFRLTYRACGQTLRQVKLAELDTARASNYAGNIIILRIFFDPPGKIVFTLVFGKTKLWFKLKERFRSFAFSVAT